VMLNRERKRAEAFRLRREGLSLAEIGERIGVAASTVQNWLRGYGERCLVRECKLCGERFLTSTALQRYCTPAHARKHESIYGPPRRVELLRQRARQLDAEIDLLARELEQREAA
jgi:transcriptional regulator with XRE-family HTH domain